jgi:hypothetical protein
LHTRRCVPSVAAGDFGGSGSASDPTPTADGSNGGRPSHSREPPCMCCVACTHSQPRGTLKRQTLVQASPLAYFRRSPGLRWGGAAGIRTPDLLIAKACPVPRSPVYALHELTADRQSALGFIGGGHRGGRRCGAKFEATPLQETSEAAPVRGLQGGLRGRRGQGLSTALRAPAGGPQLCQALPPYYVSLATVSGGLAH